MAGKVKGKQLETFLKQKMMAVGLGERRRWTQKVIRRGNHQEMVTDYLWGVKEME